MLRFGANHTCQYNVQYNYQEEEGQKHYHDVLSDMNNTSE